MSIPDKIVISGFSGGLGQALVKSLPLEKIVGINRQIYYPGIACKQFVLDISDTNITEYILRQYADEHEMEKVAIILAAGRLGNKGGLADGEFLDWEYTFRTNVLGNMAVIKAFLPNIFKTDYGRIVFIAGGGAAYGYPLFSGYSLSKVAIVREVENIAEELKYISDFSIIALAPGAMETKMLKRVREAGAEIKTTVPIEETVEFIKDFIYMDKREAKGLSGRFIHVRDDLTSEDFKNKWKLRRIE